MRKKALITGGAGFIGANTAKRLLEEGWHVTIFDNLSRRGVKTNLTFLTSTFKRAPLDIIIADIRDKRAVKFQVKKTEVIYHMAGQVAVTTSFLHPREDFEVNALGTFNILEAARESGHKPIVIYASTNKVYGQMENIKVNGNTFNYSYIDYKEGINEDQPLDFHSPYGCSKGVGDQYTRDYYRMYDLPTVVFRQSCIYGTLQMGMEDQGWVAYLAAAAVLRKPVTIYGDGRQTRDLLYIDDLVNAYQLAVRNIKKTRGQVYNIGGGLKHAFSLLEYISFLEDILEKDITIRHDAWRPGDQKVYISDTKKIERELGWKIKTCHREGLRKLVKWISENKISENSFY